MAGIPPAVICNSLQDALKTAVGIEEVPPGDYEVCRLDARGHVLELMELGMSVEHIAESAQVAATQWRQLSLVLQPSLWLTLMRWRRLSLSSPMRKPLR